MKENISRNKFLKSLRFKGASLLAVYCGAASVSSCINEAGDPPGGTTGGETGLDFTLDLNDNAYSSLKSVGNYLIVDKVVVARVSEDAFAAVTLICTHENRAKIIYQGTGFYCTEHGAKYTITGEGLNSEDKKGINAYNTAFTDSTLRVYA